MAHDRVSVLQALETQGVCPVFYHPDAEVSLNVIRACARGGGVCSGRSAQPVEIVSRNPRGKGCLRFVFSAGACAVCCSLVTVSLACVVSLILPVSHLPRAGAPPA